MKNFKKVILILPFLFILQNVIAQKNFLEGKIINLEGETIEGFINYKNWKVNPKKISFKEKMNGNEIKYSPQEINGFSVAGEIYVSANIKIETGSNEPRKLSELKELALVEERVFLQTLVKGDKSLYQYQSKIKPLFYIKENDKYIFLAYKQYIREVNTKKIVSEYKEYLSQLLEYLKECPTIQKQAVSTEYEKEEIEKLFESYYDCVSSDPVFVKKREKFVKKFGAYVGLSTARVRFHKSSSLFTGFGYLEELDYSGNPNFTAGLTLEIFKPRNRNRISFVHELSYTSYNISGRSESTFPPEGYSRNNIEFQFSYINANFIQRVRFYSIKDVGIYGFIGISGGLTLKKYTNRKSEIKYSGSTEPTIANQPIVRDPNSYEFGYLGGLGLRTNKVTGELRYQWRTGISDIPNLGIFTNQFSFLVGYQF